MVTFDKTEVSSKRGQIVTPYREGNIYKRECEIGNEVIRDEITSGNVLLSLSDHFSQIISVKREQTDLKKSISFKETTLSS